MKDVKALNFSFNISVQVSWVPVYLWQPQKAITSDRHVFSWRQRFFRNGVSSGEEKLRCFKPTAVTTWRQCTDRGASIGGVSATWHRSGFAWNNVRSGIIIGVKKLTPKTGKPATHFICRQSVCNLVCRRTRTIADRLGGVASQSTACDGSRELAQGVLVRGCDGGMSPP